MIMIYGPEETTCIEQGVGKHLEMSLLMGVNGAMSVQSMGEMGIALCPNFR